MKNFNKVITVEVSVDSIANLLLDSMSTEFKHRESVVESIVGRMMNDGSLSYLYNSLNGYSSAIDFQVGDVVSSINGFRTYAYWTQESIDSNNTVYGSVYEGRIVEINEFADKKIRLEYTVPNKKGGFDTNTQWLSHTEWNKVVASPVLL
jgi:hypothetical protein